MKRTAWIAFYISLIALFFYLDLHKFISLDSLKHYRADMLAFVDSHPLISALLYVILYASLIALSVPGGSAMTITGGFLFGALWGMGLAVTAATLGATGIFFLVQTTFGKPLKARAGPWLKKMSAGFQENAFSYLLILRLVPLFPFFVVNLVPGLLGVSTRVYILATAIGIVPGTYVLSSFGTGIGQIIDSGSEISTKGILTPEIVTALIGLAILSLLPVIYKKYKNKR
ncbi:MAG: TVP38/TMEM64 family protein [Alphaproteobacteria bacterium]|nr:TVP38/TMEM64 family protein [Alphaproteobacteria bacterium]